MKFHDAVYAMIKYSKMQQSKVFVCTNDNSFVVEVNGKIVRMGVRLCRLRKNGRIAFNNCDFNSAKQRIPTKCDRLILITPVGLHYVIDPRNYEEKHVTIETKRLLGVAEWYSLAKLHY